MENTTTVSARVDANVVAAARQKLAEQGLTVSEFVRLALIKAARGEVDVLQLQATTNPADEVSQMNVLVEDLINYPDLVNDQPNPMCANALKSLLLMHVCLDCYLDRPVVNFAQWQTLEMERLKPDDFDGFYAMVNADSHFLARSKGVVNNRLLLNALDNYHAFLEISEQQKSLRSFMKELFAIFKEQVDQK